MKRHLFSTLLIAALSPVAFAQTSVETAIELRTGYNEWTPETTDEVEVYWKYTAEESSFLTVEATSIQQLEAFELEGSERKAVNPAQGEQYVIQNYPLMAGKTIYFQMPVYDGLKATFDLKVTQQPNLGKGLAETDPMPVEVGGMYYMGNQYEFSNQNFYATYTADKDGLLVMTSPTAVTGIEVEGIVGLKFDPTFIIDRGSQHQCKMPVEQGKTYLIKYSNYGPFMLDVAFEDAERGSLYMPFTLKEGNNTVPAGAGDYYYIYSNDKAGFGVISGEGSLDDGQVKIFPDDKSLVEAGYTLATSEVGSFDTRWEMQNPGTIYYVCVSKATATAEEQVMTFAWEDYKAGEKESNPIMIDNFPAELTTEKTEGVTFYAVDVPAGANKMLSVKALSPVQSGYTKVEVYLEGNSYSAVSGNTSAYTAAYGGEQGQRYIIKWTSSETEQISFSVTMDDIQQGDVITNPLEAKLGENVIDNKGGFIKYYQYTAGRTGKLYFSGPNNMFVSFPMGTGVYDDDYLTVRGDNMEYILEITEGETYLIEIEGALDGDKFTLEEKDYELGEGRINPIIVEGDSYTFGSEAPTNLWLQYTMTDDGVLTIASDKLYNEMGYDEIYYCKGVDGEPVAISTAYFDGTTASTIYRVDVAAKAGDVFLVNVKITTVSEGNKVTFTERGYEKGESVGTAIELSNGETVAIPEVKVALPHWYKARLEPGEVTVTTDAPFMTNPVWFASEADALAGTGGTAMVFENSFDDNYDMVCTWKTTVATEGYCYIRIDDAYSGINMTVTGSFGTGIDSVEAASGVLVGDGCISVSGDADVMIYTTSGVLVAKGRGSDQSFNLEPGIYVVKVGGNAMKVAVR